MEEDYKYPDNIQFSDNLNSMDCIKERDFMDYKCISVKSYPPYDENKINFYIHLN